MEYARRLIAAQRRTLKARFRARSMARHLSDRRARAAHGISRLRTPRRDRHWTFASVRATATAPFRTVTTVRDTTAARVKASDQRLRARVGWLAQRARDPRWLMRTCGIAGAAMLLIAIVFSSHAPHSPTAVPPSASAQVVGPSTNGLTSAPSGSAPSVPATSSRAVAKESKVGPAPAPAHASRPSAHPAGGAAASAISSRAKAGVSQPSRSAASGSAAPASVTTTTHHTAVAPPSPPPAAAPARPSAPAPAPNGCQQLGIICQKGLIYGQGGGSLASAPAISLADYQATPVQRTTLLAVETKFGRPDSRASLKALLGSGWSTTLASENAAGLSCAYYLNAAARTTRAFQLCFDGAQMLVQKAILSTSGGQ